ncbi:hypothetical protein EVAR_96513_1 [Eumeta japonica]|uniref:Endonuclease/exonuclease/phosphatase domain-containing protein n=1 Tax=Eumeta variegata TaxID=151549 RepID=A0A4C1WCT3_EUMVA|nr:hypothetical protein EVAR_96513_1 [Eumeta japonica]
MRLKKKSGNRLLASQITERNHYTHKGYPLSVLSVLHLVGSSDHEIRPFAAYGPPGTQIYVQNIHSIFNGPTPTLIISDLNDKYKTWGSLSISRAGRLLVEKAERQGYEVLGPDTPTHVPTDPLH